jgi:hypothetical protein
MAMTPYSGDTSVIGKLGTTPQERGLTTQQFKDKFDEGLKTFVEWFNETHNGEINAHMAENVHRVTIVTRNLSTAGVQSISLPFKAKKIEIRAIISDTNIISIGTWAENGTQNRISCRSDGTWDASSQIISLTKVGTYQVISSIQNVSETGFELNWSIVAGSPTDTANLTIIASTHY